MYWQRARHPRAGVAIGLAVLVSWLGALGLALATSEPVDGQRAAVTGADAVETAQTGPTTPTEFRTK
jgi:uncharacterized membrane protein (DUF441 family)